MKERAEIIFPYALAAIIPLAGLVLAVVWAAEKRTYDAAIMVAAAVLGTVVWALVLTS